MQKWVTKATTPPAATPAEAGDPREVYLPARLLHCRFCHQDMNPTEPPDPAPGYQCPAGCRPRPLAAVALADTVGRAILHHAPRLIPRTGAPAPPHLVAIHAERVLARVTAGATTRDLTLTWRPEPLLAVDQHDAERGRRLAAARMHAATDPLRARRLLRDTLAGVNPATAPAHPLHADAATLLAELLLRLDQPTDAVPWATYAHHSMCHLHGPTQPRVLDALHLLALAHRRAGHPQRAHHLYRQLAEHLAATEGPHAHRTLATLANTALVLHDLGHCHAARALLADTITTHRRHHPGHPATARMTHHLTRIWRDCAAQGHHHDQDT